ncbi:hypothetical protein [Calothrix sp. UHCC 0171]|uniref:hypothetical protein n=1 Tax=Calothrix sp. UHCC 0171 TaxID=3110245 RepID=UPI002B21E963|nr:hypothetical protein [Calothrix sp. UHCC 0171]MEA5574063.1 hypothetical protein [Calothrix sp. UHCC 0171]
MALNKPHSGVPQSIPTDRGSIPQKQSPDFMQTAVSWCFKVITFPLWIVTAIFHQMLTPGASGATFLGKVIFIFLVVLSADSYWQVLFQNLSLFPWYETQWTGWGWLPALKLFPVGFSLGLLGNPIFYICVTISFVIQMFQSAFVTGEKFITGNPKLLGLIAVALYSFDIIMTFSSRNPWRYSDPGQVLQCILFNLFTISCAELGRWGEKVLAGKK